MLASEHTTPNGRWIDGPCCRQIGGGFGLGEEVLRAVGEFACEAGIAGLVGQERLVGAVAGLAGDGEGILAFLLQQGVEAEQVPVAGLDSRFHFVLAVVHAAWNTKEFTMETQPLHVSD